ncbi:MAG: hypothetical protein IJ491_08265 [Clostridia bacterium]|nr:hypothetical protein [Clostridia bacterium]
MASKCPNCGRQLKWYNIKADCPDCGISIPNYNWEARLEEDNIKAEAKFRKFYNTLNKLKYSVFGTKLRIARIVMSFIPAIGFILPWANVTSAKDTLSFDLLGLFTDGTSTLDFFGIFFKSIGDVLSAMSGEGFSGPVSYIVLGFLFMLLSVVAIVVAFFLIFICFRKPKTKATVVADAVSLVFAAIGAVMFILSGSKSAGAAFSIATLNFENAASGVLWGSFVYVALLAVALVGNILVAKAPVKSDEELENERLERVRIKEEKEEQARIKKEAARLEAQKKAEEEQAEKIRKAKEALAKKDKK